VYASKSASGGKRLCYNFMKTGVLVTSLERRIYQVSLILKHSVHSGCCKYII